VTPAESQARVLEFTRRPFAAVAALEDPDGRGARLLEPATAKELRLRWDELAQVEERSSPLRPAPYLVLDTGASIAPYNHFELGQPVLIEYVWGRQIGENTINP